MEFKRLQISAGCLHHPWNKRPAPGTMNAEAFAVGGRPSVFLGQTLSHLFGYAIHLPLIYPFIPRSVEVVHDGRAAMIFR